MTTQYTSTGMPIVSKETLDAFVARFAGRGRPGNSDWGQYLTSVQQRIAREDPKLVMFIESQVGRYQKEVHTELFSLLIGVYALLESQTQANRLKEDLDP